MGTSTTNKRRVLRFLERALRPSAAATRDLTFTLARALDDVEHVTAAVGHLTNQVDRLSERIDRLAAQSGRDLDELESVIAGLAASLGASNAMYDYQTRQLLRRALAPDGVGVDVGAHEGDILHAMVEAAPGVAHHAFEPLPELARRLRERFPSVVVHEVALAEEPGEVEFHHVVTNPAYSGLRARRYDRQSEQVERIRVRAARLDDELPDDVPVRAIKIDVEGGELGVIRGAEATIRRWRPIIVFEHGEGAADFYGVTPHDMHEALADLGYAIHRLGEPDDGPGLSRDELVDEFHTNRNYYFVARFRA